MSPSMPTDELRQQIVTMPKSTVAATESDGDLPDRASVDLAAVLMRNPPTLPKYTQAKRNGNAASVVSSTRAA